MRPYAVVVHPPLIENDPHARQAPVQLPVEQLFAEPAVEALRRAVLLKNCLLDV